MSQASTPQNSSLAQQVSTHEQHPEEQVGDEEEGAEFVADEDVLQVEELQIDGAEPMEDDDDDDDLELGDEQDQQEDAADNLLNNGFDDSTLTFSQHEGAVFAVSLHPTRPTTLACSGGEDDVGILFNPSSGQVIRRLDGHTDSVTCVGFNWDGELVASGGMDGKVRIWARSSKSTSKEDFTQWGLIQDLEGPDEVNWLDWHPKGNFLLAGGADGSVWMWNLPMGDVVRVLTGHTTPVTCGRWTPDGKKFITCSEDSTMILWDPRNGEQIHKLSPNDGRFRLKGGINCITINPAGTVAILGGAEGGLRAINLVTGVVLAQMQGHEEGTSVEQVAFSEVPTIGSQSLSVIVSVGTDGRVCTWEAGSFKLRSTGKHEDAVTCLAFSPGTTTFITGSADHTLKIWDYRRGTCEKTLLGHRDVIHACAVSKDGTVVISGGEDGEVKVFKPFEERKDPLEEVVVEGGGGDDGGDSEMKE